MKKTISILALIVFLSSTSLAAENQCIYYYSQQGCAYCAQAETHLQALETKYPLLDIKRFDVTSNETARQTLLAYFEKLRVPYLERGTPFLVIGETYLSGSDQITNQLENQILSQQNPDCPQAPEQKQEQKINPWIILGAAVIDGINPCAFAVMIFLATFLLALKKTEKEIMKTGAAYILAVYTTYFLAGLGLLQIVQSTGIATIFKQTAALVAILAGLVNIKDYFWYGKGLSLKGFGQGKKQIENLVHKANVPAAFLLGIFVSLWELPCTGEVYLIILSMLSNALISEAIIYLLLYNLVFVLPLVAILFAVTKGVKPETIEKWRAKEKNVMKLASGLLLTTLGIALLLNII